MSLAEHIAQTDYDTLAPLIARLAQMQPEAWALADDHQRLSYAELDAVMNRVAAALQRDGIAPGQAIAICAQGSVAYASLFLGALRAGVVVAPLAPSSTAQTLAVMVRDAQAQRVFIDASTADLFDGIPGAQIWLDDQAPPHEAAANWSDWLAAPGVPAAHVDIDPLHPFNIIYSSGTTGTPKGIVQPHGMRWAHIKRGSAYGYSSQTVALLSTPLYSNTTLVIFFPTLAHGGLVRIMPKFDAGHYLRIAQDEGVTHTMLVPVQYHRLLAHPEFDAHDLSRFEHKFCTSAPMPKERKAEILRRWPGGFVEFYGMTEGGASFILNAHEHPDKLHTVGRAASGCVVKIIDESGQELPPGSKGEVVGHSKGMMNGYHGQADKTREAEWFDADGLRYIRTGDIGQLDEDGFLVLMDRRKDMVISGGFNIYPSDLEAQLRDHPAIDDAAVVGVPSEAWGETPVAFVVLRDGRRDSADELRAWFNGRVGKTQRLHDLIVQDELPRSAIGKVLKRELREHYAATH
jgi:acyl-CoA synthetase (AMP-forming)/AMP-acid ligase II